MNAQLDAILVYYVQLSPTPETHKGRAAIVQKLREQDAQTIDRLEVATEALHRIAQREAAAGWQESAALCRLIAREAIAKINGQPQPEALEPADKTPLVRAHPEGSLTVQKGYIITAAGKLVKTAIA